LQDDGNVPATNIDDVKISILEETEKHQRETSEKHKHDKADTAKKFVPHSDNNKMRDSQKQRDSTKSHQKSDQSRSESQKSRNFEPESKKSDITRNGHEQEAIHIQLGRAESNHNADSKSSQSHDTSKNRDSTSKLGESGEKQAPNPHLQHIQNQSNVKRTASFQKRSESQRRRSMEHLGGSENDVSESQPKYPPGTQTGTLADLKKQRAQNKFGSTDGMVANLFLQSLSTDSKKYSTGSSSAPAPAVPKDKAQNGRASTKSNLNNNAPPSQQRPPTYISDNGPLRKYSAPTSSPVIGEDDKFKNDCCVIL